jgi:hypothetical protein
MLKSTQATLSIYIFTFAFILSCSSSSNNYYVDKGLSFKIPDGFKIKEAIPYKNGVTYISICPKEKNVPGVYLVIWTNDSLNLDSELDRYVNELNNGYVRNDLAAPAFTEKTTTHFASYSARYTFLDPNVSPIGGHHYWAFHIRNKTVIFSLTYDNGHFSDFTESFNIIEKSIK